MGRSTGGTSSPAPRGLTAPLCVPPQEGYKRCPPSILRQSRPERRSRGAEPQKTARHVRFREPPEVAVHCKGRTRPAGPGTGGAGGHVSWDPQEAL